MHSHKTIRFCTAIVLLDSSNLDTCLCSTHKAMMAFLRWILFMLSLQDGLGDNRLGNTSEGRIGSEELAKDKPEGGSVFGS
jgi:hypothetical protein